MQLTVERSSPVEQSARVKQVAGIFDLALGPCSTKTWSFDLPFEDQDWSIGLIVGPSGSGKSTLLVEGFGSASTLTWSPTKTVVDDFDPALSAKDITGALSSVGFSSPPSWMRPYGVLSTGEQFRAELARRLLETEGIVIIDEFTSVVDRRVAKVASAAVAKYVRRTKRQLIAATCHYDIIEWLQPDWVYDAGKGEFTRGCLQPRPTLNLTIRRGDPTDWPTFRQHHYLTGKLNPKAHCWVAEIEGAPAGFASGIVYPTPSRQTLYREHRTVVVPDFQGVGVGNALSEFVGSLYRGAGARFRSVTGSPAMIHHRARSPLWLMDRKPGLAGSGRSEGGFTTIGIWDRLTASFEYVGPAADRALTELMLPELIHGYPIRRLGRHGRHHH